MTPPQAQDAESRPARERVYAHVREQILRGVYAGGSFVEEEAISSVMGVSRTPVREAFHRLEAERFIDLLPRRGALVRQVTAQELADLYETRRMIEGYAVARICRERIVLPETMEAVLDRLDAIAGSDHFARVELNREFHFGMVQALGNEVLSELTSRWGRGSSGSRCGHWRWIRAGSSGSASSIATSSRRCGPSTRRGRAPCSTSICGP